MKHLRSALKHVVMCLLSPVRADLKADPSLRYVLLLALVTCGFGIWFRVPNFAGPDEYSRLLQPMKVAGEFLADPGFESIRRGVTDGRALGATFYLYAIVLAPVFLLVIVSGQISEFVTLGTIQSRWDLWHAAPAWFWKTSILLGRLVSVALGVGCVYLTYRLGARLESRFAGKLAAVLLALSPGFFSQTHLVGEDAPMLFLLLATTLLADRYIETGDTATFLWGTFSGGLAIAFKLSGGVAALILGAALFVRAASSDDPIDELARPLVVLGGLVVGTMTIWVGIPSVLLGGPTELFTRIGGSIASKTTKTGGLDAPISYWLLRQYVRGLGLPLFATIVAGAAVTALRVASRRSRTNPLYLLLFVSIAVFLLVYSRWEFVRLRHIVPTFPSLLILLGAAASRWWESNSWGTQTAIRAVIALVLVSTILTAGLGEIGYLTEPRDQATAWIESNTEPGERVEVYENSIADVAVPHDWKTIHYDYPEEQATLNSSLVLNESQYTGWMRSMPERGPKYIQITSNELAYIDPTSTDYHQYPERREYLAGLLGGEYNYTVVSEFGRWERTETRRADFMRAIFRPKISGQEDYVVILVREDREGTRASTVPSAVIESTAAKHETINHPSTHSTKVPKVLYTSSKERVVSSE